MYETLDNQLSYVKFTMKYLFTKTEIGWFHNPKVGGATRDRTADLLRARQALSQLSYSPFRLSRFHLTPVKGLFRSLVDFVGEAVYWQ